MALIHYENWDGVVPPAIPSGWSVAAQYTTTTAAHGITPTSSPNMLAFTPSTASTYFATYGTADTTSGNVAVQANINLAQISGESARLGVTARGSAATLNLSSTSTYAAWIDYINGVIACSKIVNGTETILFNPPISLTVATWYTLYLTVNNSQLTVSIQRITDGYWFTTSGGWMPSQGFVEGISDTSITGSGYAGILLEQEISAGGFYGYFDDWYFNSIVTIPIPKPLVVYYPREYYPFNAE
jgi:hypothetical protein